MLKPNSLPTSFMLISKISSREWIMDAKIIPRKNKEDYLEGLSEDEFRDRLVRPLFIRKGFRHGAELCGPNEEGKDCYFTRPAPFGGEHIWVVQTKTGNLTLGRDPGKNLLEAETQLKTALSTPVHNSETKHKSLPHFAVLCTSGQIAHSAKTHITNTLAVMGGTNIVFLDIDSLIPEVDELYPEFWLGINADRIPYIQNLLNKLYTENDFSALASLVASNTIKSPVSDAGYVPVKLNRAYLVSQTRYGQITQVTKYEEKDVNDLLHSNHNRFWIVGDAGAGKTTVLKRIAEQLCKQGTKAAKLPVFVKAVDVAASDRPLSQQLFDVTSALTQSGNPAFEVTDLEDGKLCILIDAIDEVGTSAALSEFVKKLSAFEKDFRKNLIVITSRNYSYLIENGRWGHYYKYNISPISFSQASKILKNFSTARNLPTERARELIRQLENIHGFELNPLVVTVFAASSDSSRKDIPSNITELFSKFVETMLGRWDSQKGLSQQYEANMKALLLGSIARRMHANRKIRISTEEFEQQLIQDLGELGVKDAKIDVLVEEITVRSGLLRDVDGHTEFRHLLLQEYFAGRALKADDDLIAFAQDEWWQRAIVFHFGSNPANEEGLRALMSKNVGTDRMHFALAVTLGLSAQACYFVKQAAKAEIMDYVLNALTQCAVSSLTTEDRPKYPLHSFLEDYLMARDSVGADCITELIKYQPTLEKDADLNKQLKEFWLIVGLMESNHLEEAWARIKLYFPEKRLPVLAIHLGAFFISHVRSVPPRQKELAKKIFEKLQPQVDPLIKDYLKEFRTQLLEWQRGEVKAVELPDKSGPRETDIPLA